jgi:hypothetical protein
VRVAGGKLRGEVGVQPGPEVADVVEDFDGAGLRDEAVGWAEEDGLGCVGEVADPVGK